MRTALSPAAGAMPTAAAGRSSAIEEYLVVAALAALVAMPYLLGMQPVTNGSAEEMGIPYYDGDGDVATQMVLAALYAGFGVALLWKVRWQSLLALGAPLILLVGWCMASALWSDLPSLTLRRVAALDGPVVIGMYAGLRFSFEDLCRIFCRLVAVVLLASVLAGVVTPSLIWDAEGRLRGVLSHKNTFSAFVGFGLVTIMARIASTGWRSGYVFELVTAAGCLIGLVLALSASPLPTIAFALLALLWVRKCRSSAANWSLALVLALVCLAGLVTPFIGNQLGGLANALGRDADFSGRTLVWEFGVDLWSRDPLLGFGYGVFWQGEAGALFLRWSRFAVPHAHNGWLQLALDAGGIGVVLFLCGLATTLFRATRLLNAGELARMSWPMAFIAFYLISNVVETQLWEGNNLLTALFVAVVVRTNLLAKTIAEPQVRRRGMPLHAERAHG